jgi:hypothetical protein
MLNILFATALFSNPSQAKFSVPYYEIIYMKNLSIWKVPDSIPDEVIEFFQLT